MEMSNYPRFQKTVFLSTCPPKGDGLNVFPWDWKFLDFMLTTSSRKPYNSHRIFTLILGSIKLLSFGPGQRFEEVTDFQHG